MSDWSEWNDVPDIPYTSGFNEAYKDKFAECDGGMHVSGNLSGRQDFAGKLTGDYRDYGDFPWRWYLLTDLARKPEGYGHMSVWCDEGSLIFIDKP